MCNYASTVSTKVICATGHVNKSDQICLKWIWIFRWLYFAETAVTKRKYRYDQSDFLQNKGKIECKQTKYHPDLLKTLTSRLVSSTSIVDLMNLKSAKYKFQFTLNILNFCANSEDPISKPIDQGLNLSACTEIIFANHSVIRMIRKR